MSSKSRNRNRKTTAGPQKATNVRQQKRAQFEEPKKGVGLHVLLAGIALIVVVAVAAFVVMSRGGTGAEAATATAVAPSGDVKIPVADIADGQAKFYSYDAGGIEVKYFVMKSSDGEYRAAFDACDVCFQFKKGYHQEGDEMVCNNCGRRFPSTKINVLEGGCNPSPLDRTVKGKNLVLKTADLQAGVQYFQ